MKERRRKGFHEERTKTKPQSMKAMYIGPHAPGGEIGPERGKK